MEESGRVGGSTGVAPNACEKATRKVRGGYIKLGD
jgi:hypothetical protein